jgi:hypothetical protein
MKFKFHANYITIRKLKCGKTFTIIWSFSIYKKKIFISSKRKGIKLLMHDAYKRISWENFSLFPKFFYFKRISKFFYFKRISNFLHFLFNEQYFVIISFLKWVLQICLAIFPLHEWEIELNLKTEGKDATELILTIFFRLQAKGIEGHKISIFWKIEEFYYHIN